MRIYVRRHTKEHGLLLGPTRAWRQVRTAARDTSLNFEDDISDTSRTTAGHCIRVGYAESLIISQ